MDSFAISILINYGFSFGFEGEVRLLHIFFSFLVRGGVLTSDGGGYTIPGKIISNTKRARRRR